MALPKKRFKRNENLGIGPFNKEKLVGGPGAPMSIRNGNDDWREQLLEQNKTFLPRPVYLEDLDEGFVSFVEEDLKLVIKGEKIPVTFLTLQRWTEFLKTWQYSDKYKNIKIPFISIVRKPSVEKGTNVPELKIPVRKTFPYMKVPVWNGNRKGMDIYKIPQPVHVDVTYMVRLFSFKMRELNRMHHNMLSMFASGQAFINVNGHYFPIELNSIGDESVVDSLDGKRYYVQAYELKLKGYLLDEEEFEVVPAIERGIITTEVQRNRVKKQIKINKDCDNTDENKDC